MSLIRTLCVLADFSFMLGAIDSTEYAERIAIARWIADEADTCPDPRGGLEEREIQDQEPPEGTSSLTVAGAGRLEDPDWLEFVAFGQWYFTKSDPDPYPSTPHGHLQSSDRPWPKLNPYTGRVFAAKHQEDSARRLTKRQMRELWRTEAFRDFCRSHIVWYAEAHRHHAFGVSHPMRFPRW